MQEIPKRSMVIDAWGFIRGTPSYFPVSVNERPEDCNEEMNRTGDDVISCMKCFCCILHLYRKLEIGDFGMNIYAEWKVMTIQSSPPGHRN